MVATVATGSRSANSHRRCLSHTSISPCSSGVYVESMLKPLLGIRPRRLTIEYTDQYITDSKNHSRPSFIFSTNNLSISFHPQFFQYTCTDRTRSQSVCWTSDSFSTPIQYMRIDHRGTNIIVSQKFLNCTNIITIFRVSASQ